MIFLYGWWIYTNIYDSLASAQYASFTGSQEIKNYSKSKTRKGHRTGIKWKALGERINTDPRLSQKLFK